jgi:hypothetical protein
LFVPNHGVYQWSKKEFCFELVQAIGPDTCLPKNLYSDLKQAVEPNVWELKVMLPHITQLAMYFYRSKKEGNSLDVPCM